MKQFVRNIFKDKEGQYAMREVSTILLVAALLVSWIAQQFFSIPMPEYMFYAFSSLVGAGSFGYSIERKSGSLKRKRKFNDDEI